MTGYREVILLILAGICLAEIPCGLPPFVDKLPEKQSTELKEIWSSYEKESECEDEQKKTFAVVSTLTSEERSAVFGAPPEPIVVDAFDTVPFFIRSLAPAVKEEFDAIWGDRDGNDDDKYAALEKLAEEKFDEEQKKGFKNWLEQIKKAKNETEERIAKLSTEAKNILEELKEVRLREREIMKKLTPELSNELHGLL